MLVNGMCVCSTHQGSFIRVATPNSLLGKVLFSTREDILFSSAPWEGYRKRILWDLTPRCLTNRTYRPGRELAVTRPYRALPLRLGRLGRYNVSKKNSWNFLKLFVPLFAFLKPIPYIWSPKPWLPHLTCTANTRVGFLCNNDYECKVSK